VVVGNLDQNNSYAVRILDPHLHQPPGLLLRATHHRHSRGQQPPTLRFDVTHLNPKGQAVPGCMGRPATNLEEAAAEKEHQARVILVAKLSIDRQPQRVPVESSASLRLRRTQQNAATQYLHTLHPALLPGSPKALSLLIAEVAPGSAPLVCERVAVELLVLVAPMIPAPGEAPASHRTPYEI
jgi:hypothetical protein